MKWLLGILAAVVIVPVLAIAAWQQWGKTLPREPMVNCDHIPYLRAQIGDTLLTIPRKYAGRSSRVEGDGTTGDFYGRCQNENDPPVQLSSLTIDSTNPNEPDLEGKNIPVFAPYFSLRFYRHHQDNIEYYKYDVTYKGLSNGLVLNLGKNSSFSASSSAVYNSEKKAIDFDKKLKVMIWALTQPPTAGLITSDGDFDLAKLHQKENAS
jgi:hypothetical protein